VTKTVGTDRKQVDDFHAAALKAGGKDYGAPGIRKNYHPGYYGAYVIDPAGHNIEVVIHEAPEVKEGGGE
jgi:predicted lactoylglutathione lyase